MRADISKTKQKLEKTKKRIVFETGTLINGALAFVAALAWNEAIKALIDAYLPKGSGLPSKFLYALFVTLIVILISVKLTTLIEVNKLEDEAESKEK